MAYAEDFNQENRARFSGAKETSLQDMDQGQLNRYSKLYPKITSIYTFSHQNPIEFPWCFVPNNAGNPKPSTYLYHLAMVDAVCIIQILIVGMVYRSGFNTLITEYHLKPQWW